METKFALPAFPSELAIELNYGSGGGSWWRRTRGRATGVRQPWWRRSGNFFLSPLPSASLLLDVDHSKGGNSETKTFPLPLPTFLQVAWRTRGKSCGAFRDDGSR